MGIDLVIAFIGLVLIEITLILSSIAENDPRSTRYQTTGAGVAFCLSIFLVAGYVFGILVEKYLA